MIATGSFRLRYPETSLCRYLRPIRVTVNYISNFFAEHPTTVRINLVRHTMPDKNNTNLAKTPPFPRFSANSRLKYVQYIYASLYQKSSEISMFWSERV